MKKAIIPPTLLTVANASPLRIIATKSSATVIKESDSAFWSTTKILAINNKTNQLRLKLPDTVMFNEPDWFANYE